MLVYSVLGLCFVTLDVCFSKANLIIENYIDDSGFNPRFLLEICVRFDHKCGKITRVYRF